MKSKTINNTEWEEREIESVEGWEEDFNKKFGELFVMARSGESCPDYFETDIKQFIRQTLQDQKQSLIKKVEGMRKGEWHEHNGKDCLIANDLEKYYNQAIDDLLKLLSKPEGESK